MLPNVFSDMRIQIIFAYQTEKPVRCTGFFPYENQMYCLISSGSISSVTDEVMTILIFHFSANAAASLTNMEKASISFLHILIAESINICVISLLEA